MYSDPVRVMEKGKIPPLLTQLPPFAKGGSGGISLPDATTTRSGNLYYEIRIEWDAEAGVWYIEDSNVPGLVGEAPTLEIMIALLQVRVPEVLEENGCPMHDEIPLRLLTTAHLAQMRKAA